MTAGRIPRRLLGAAFLVSVLVFSTFAHAYAVVRCSMMGDTVRKSCCCPPPERVETDAPAMAATPCCTPEIVGVTKVPAPPPRSLEPAVDVPVSTHPVPASLAVAPPRELPPLAVEHPPLGPPLILTKHSRLI